MRRFVVVVLAATLALGGCLGPAVGIPKANNAPAAADQLLAGPALWNDPQNAPHPAFGWPTLSSPPNGTNLPPFWTPIAARALPNSIVGLQHLAQAPDPVRTGGGIAIFGHVVVVPGYGKPTYILDVSDPSNPKELSNFMPQEGMGSHRGAATIAYPDGRLVVVISTPTGIDVWNITDPAHPQGLPTLKVSSHKVGVIPGTPIVVDARSAGGGNGVPGIVTGLSDKTATGVTEMFDLTDPQNPVRLKDFQNGFSCHHVYFWNDLASKKYRGICAGDQYAQLWDTTNPREPRVIVNVPIFHGNPAAPSTSLTGVTPWAHYAGLSLNGKILIVGDEFEGGSLPPGCTASAKSAQGGASAPIGALWFYDVSTETSPKLLGWYSVQDDPRTHAGPTTSCTAHHGRLVPAEGRDLIAMSFYGAGVVLVDFTGINFQAGKLPRSVDAWADASNTWETWYDQGYLFTGDEARGLDSFTFR